MATRSIHEYCSANPAPVRHRTAGDATAMKRNPLSAGWAWKPDAATRKALARGTRKMKGNSTSTEGEAKMATSKKTAKKTSAKKVSKKAAAKKAPAKKASKKKAPAKAAANGTPLKKICQELKIDPKLARRKLRNSDVFAGREGKERWTFSTAQAEKARQVLTA